MHRVLFICSRNRLRSPSAERLFADWPGVETDSAGLAADAETPWSGSNWSGRRWSSSWSAATGRRCCAGTPRR